MIGTCSKCGKLYDFQSEEDAYAPDRLCADCYKAQQAKTFRCNCGACRRKLYVERAAVGGFVLTMIDPDFEWSEPVTAEELAARIAEAEEEFFLVTGEGSDGSISLSGRQLASLRKWAGIEAPAPAKPLTKAQRAVMTTLVDVAQNEGGSIILKNRYHSAAMALVRRGFVEKVDRDLYRPLYIVTPAGLEYWRTITQQPDKPLTADQVRAMFAAMDKAAGRASRTKGMRK